ncbi:Actin [Durusdinium trenchii]|uniref:Indirect flight muscle n=1 Tax=Durusdinium trenchii TaxID=1381693 RepID=A0ABP0L7L7_9DINO
MYMATGAVWSLYSSGRTTGLVLDSGHSATWAIPIYEGICVTYAIQKSELAGKALTKELIEMLQQEGYSFPSLDEREILQLVKEQLCCVAPDPAGPGCTSEEALYQMPDGTILVLRSSMRVRCTERLFEKDHGLPSLLWRSITMADVDIRQEN